MCSQWNAKRKVSSERRHIFLIKFTERIQKEFLQIPNKVLKKSENTGCKQKVSTIREWVSTGHDPLTSKSVMGNRTKQEHH